MYFEQHLRLFWSFESAIRVEQQVTTHTHFCFRNCRQSLQSKQAILGHKKVSHLSCHPIRIKQAHQHPPPFWTGQRPQDFRPSRDIIESQTTSGQIPVGKATKTVTKHVQKVKDQAKRREQYHRPRPHPKVKAMEKHAPASRPTKLVKLVQVCVQDCQTCS